MRTQRVAGKVIEASSARDQVATIFASCKAVSRLHNANEAKTRVEIIDRVLGALGWESAAIDREVATGVGNFIDYELWDRDQPWLLVEAKRVGATFNLSGVLSGATAASGPQSIATLLKRGGRELRDALGQVSRYCNERGVPLGCLTNGYQWVFFIGLSSKGRPWSKGVALVFDGVEDVITRFDEFFATLGRTAAGTAYLSRALDRVGAAAPPMATVPRDMLSVRRPQLDGTRVPVFRAVCEYLLSDIYGDNREQMLERCYVEPGTEAEFERSIQRLLRDSAQTFEKELENVVDGDTRRFVEEVERHSKLKVTSSTQHPVVVFGHVGAGKSTFIHRAVARFRGSKSAICAVLDLEGAGLGTTFDATAEEKRLAADLVDKLRNAATTTVKSKKNISDAERAQADPFLSNTLKNIFWKELERERELGAAFWAADPGAWSRREYELFVALREDSFTFLQRFVRHLHGRFKNDNGEKYPVLIVIDNLDQASEEYQRCMYGVAQRLARTTAAIVVISIREDTFTRGRQPGGFLTSSPLQFVFHVAAPPLAKLLRQRVKFVAQGGAVPSALTAEKDAISDVCDVIRTAFLPERAEALELIACLCASNIRDALLLVRQVVLGSAAVREKVNSSAAYALDCLLAAFGHDALKARLVLFNCVDADPATPPAHALRARLLAYLSWAAEGAGERPLLERTETVIARFASWGYSPAIVDMALSTMLADGVVRAFEESERGPRSLTNGLPQRIAITASGHAHLTRLLALPAYRAAMACITRWYDDEFARRFIERAQAAGGEDGPTLGDIIVSKGVAIFDAYLAQMIAKEDLQLAPAMERTKWVAEVRSRSSRILPDIETTKTEPAPLPEDVGLTPVAPTVSQMNLALAGKNEPIPESLARIRRDLEVQDTVWIPRILWALEWIRRNRRGPASATEIATVLKDEGNIDVPPNNVARAFRDFKATRREVGLFWRVSGKRYEITDAGTRMILSLIAEDSA
jgi:hypothetical protein